MEWFISHETKNKQTNKNCSIHIINHFKYVIMWYFNFSAMKLSACSNQIWWRSLGICMREQRRRETQHFWMRSTQSSTSQSECERSVMSMRWDRLRHNPEEQQQRTQRSDAMTSLQLYLDKTKPSELCWQRESLALEKQSLCRSWSWTGLKGKRIRTSSSYFHFLSEKST